MHGRAGNASPNLLIHHCALQDRRVRRGFHQHNNAHAIFRATIQVVSQNLEAQLFHLSDALSLRKADQHLAVAKKVQ